MFSDQNSPRSAPGIPGMGMDVGQASDQPSGDLESRIAALETRIKILEDQQNAPESNQPG